MILPRREILLVTGARLLADTPGAESWCKVILAEELRDLSTRSVVLTGTARGPDTWAKELVLAMAAEHPLRLVTYDPDGIRRDWLPGMLVPRTSRWCSAERLNPVWKRRPIVRDKAMVDGLGEALGNGWADGATALAFYHPDSLTRGTATTVHYFRQSTDMTRVREETWALPQEKAIEPWQART